MFHMKEFFFWTNFYEAVMFILGQHCKWWLCSLIHLENFYFIKESGLQWMNDSLSCLGGFPVGLLWLVGWCRGRCTWRSPHGQMGTYLNAHLWHIFLCCHVEEEEEDGEKEDLGCLESEKVKVKSFSHVQLFGTPWTVAYQACPSMGFSRQEYWNGWPFPSPGDLPDPGFKPGSPALQADALPSEPPEKP